MWAWRGALAWGAVGGILLLPMGIPLLPPPEMARYAEAMGQTRAVTTNRGTILPLPQDFADMIGWREQVADVANTLASKIWNRWPHAWRDLIEQCVYYQERNEASYKSRRRTAERTDTS